MNRYRKAGLALLIVVALAGCRATTQSNEVGVHINGDVIIPTDPSIAGCVEPGKNQWIGWGDSAHLYPAGQRSYKFGTGSGEDFPGIPVVSSDGVEMTQSGTVTFYLNQTCKTLKAFHQQIGSKTYNGHAGYVDSGDFAGWDGLLDTYIGGPLYNVVNDIEGAKTSTDLYRSPTIRAAMEKPISAALPAAVKGLAHGDYFVNFAVSLRKPTAPAKIVGAYTDQAAAIQEKVAQDNRNLTARSQYQTVKDCKADGISESVCAFLYAVNTGHVSVIPAGAGVAIK